MSQVIIPILKTVILKCSCEIFLCEHIFTIVALIYNGGSNSLNRVKTVAIKNVWLFIFHL